MASGEVATVRARRAAPRLGDHDQRPDLGRHRTRRSSRCTTRFPIKDLVTLDDALTYGSRAAGRAVRGVHRRPRQRHRRAGARDPGEGADAERRGADRRLAGSARDRGGLRLGVSAAAEPNRLRRSGVAAAASAFKDGNLIDGLVSAVRVISAGISPAVAGYGPVRSPLRRRTDARAATARFRRGPRAPAGAVRRAAPDRRGTRRRRRCRRR